MGKADLAVNQMMGRKKSLQILSMELCIMGSRF